MLDINRELIQKQDNDSKNLQLIQFNCVKFYGNWCHVIHLSEHCKYNQGYIPDIM